MRPLYVLLTILALVAWDYGLNDGDLFWTINSQVDQMVAQLGLS